MRALLLVCLAAGCRGTSVDPTGLPSIADYRGWQSFQVDGPAAGHGNGERVIYFNDVSRTYPHAGRYPIGSVIVKEIHEGHENGAVTSLSVMRKVGENFTGYPTHDGWLFTDADASGAGEVQFDSCFQSCHRQAPHDSTWFDYGDP